MRKLVFLLALFLVFSLSACDRKAKQAAKAAAAAAATQKIITVASEPMVTRLYYTGTLEPVQTFSVFSPVDGRIHKMYFQYGETVKKGETLFSIDSEKLVDSYRQAVADYLTKKAAYINGIQEYEGNIALHNAGITDDSDFVNQKSQYDNSVLDFYQSRYALEKILNQAGLPLQHIEGLSLNDVKNLNAVLQQHFNNIIVKSPSDGVALFPISSSGDSGSSDSGSGSSSSGGAGTTVNTGSDVTENQLLLSIGNLSGFTVSLDVSEVDINRLKAGQKAVITGDGFPGVELKGSVESVSSQADPNAQSGDSGLSMFAVQIKVPNVTDKDREVVRVGMTSKVEVEIMTKPEIQIPINAVLTDGGKTQVQVIKNGKTVLQSVVTGATTEDKITIASGLVPGDKVVVPND